jgi:hypothetical protein
MIILFNSACIYSNNEIILYGQYANKFNSITINNFIITKDMIKYVVFYCNSRPDFFIKISSNIIKKNTIDNIVFHYNNSNDDIIFENINLHFPFENCRINLDKDKSAIISTMCKNYSHRLEEWIEYNLKLGFSGIIIFNNESNISNKINEPIENCIIEKSITYISDKYKDKVLIIDFPYSPLKNNHYDNIQRISLSIGVNAFKNKCRNISLIDADEFIFIPQKINIEDFLRNYNKAITMKSNILTNKNNDDIINNNVISLAEYMGEDKYTKTILNTNTINENEFIVTPHDYPNHIILSKDLIIHYHCWMNRRYLYNPNMKRIDHLKEFYQKL